eukprot:255140-Chlamydomonas_euryale.AAC.1
MVNPRAARRCAHTRTRMCACVREGRGRVGAVRSSYIMCRSMRSSCRTAGVEGPVLGGGMLGFAMASARAHR